MLFATSWDGILSTLKLLSLLLLLRQRSDFVTPSSLDKMGKILKGAKARGPGCVRQEWMQSWERDACQTDPMSKFQVKHPEPLEPQAIRMTLLGLNFLCVNGENNTEFTGLFWEWSEFKYVKWLAQYLTRNKHLTMVCCNYFHYFSPL